MILPNDSHFGFATNTNGLPQFGYNVAGSMGNTIVIEGSTNLVNWTALKTNTLGAGPLYFADPDSATNGYRFYRVRMQ